MTTLLEACKLAEDFLTDAWIDYVRSHYPRHDWDVMEKRPDLLGDIKNGFGQRAFPIAHALNQVRDAISATEEEEQPA